MPKQKKIKRKNQQLKNKAEQKKLFKRKPILKKVKAKKISKKIKRRPVKTKNKKIKAKKYQKSQHKKVKAVWPQEKAKLLLFKGKKRGFVTENELLYAFPDMEDYLKEYEKMLDDLDVLGVPIKESKTDVLEKKAKEG